MKTGKKISLNVLTHRGVSRNVTMPIGINPQDPPKSNVITAKNGSRVGYLYLESFNSVQFKEIRKHFKVFKKEAVRDLVLDLRYNSGGVMGDAATLANLIGGQTHAGKLFIKWERPVKYEDDSTEYLFNRLPDSLHTRRLVVVTTDETCSASEAIINGLRPHMPVYTVGSATCGKPYGMNVVGFGESSIHPVTARILNSRGEGHYINGIRPDFKAKDDVTHQLGDPQEGMLKKALEVLEKDTLRM